MSAKLQQIIDSLALSLRRDVSIDDQAMRLVAHSPQQGRLDQVRRESIMRRAVPADVAQWLVGLGIARQAGPVRIPGNADYGMLPRACAPVRYRDFLLGFLYVIDEPELREPDLRAIACAAEAAATALFEEHLAGQLAVSRERQHVQDLLSEDPALVRAAAANLVEEDFAPAGCVVLAIVFALPDGDGEAARDDLGQALAAARSVAAPRRMLRLMRQDHAAVLLPGRSESAIIAEAARLAGTVPRRGPASAPGSAITVGIGDTRAGLSLSGESYREARWAAEVAAAVPELGPVLAWRDLGIYRYLAQLPGHTLEQGFAHQGLSRLLAGNTGAHLLATLETYLDLAGDAQRTASALSLHRTSLYYRLDRIQQLTGADLHDGHDRLELHLALKARRLAASRRPLGRLRETASPTGVGTGGA